MIIRCWRSKCYGYVLDLHKKKIRPHFKMVNSCWWKAYTRENKMYNCWVLREGNRITPITGTGWSSNNVVTAYGHMPLTVQSHLWTSAGLSVASCTQQSYVQHSFSLPAVSAHSISRTFPETNYRTSTNSGISPFSVSVCVEQLVSWLGFWLNFIEISELQQPIKYVCWIKQKKEKEFEYSRRYLEPRRENWNTNGNTMIGNR